MKLFELLKGKHFFVTLQIFPLHFEAKKNRPGIARAICFYLLVEGVLFKLF